jgi:hypothetical protein
MCKIANGQTRSKHNIEPLEGQIGQGWHLYRQAKIIDAAILAMSIHHQNVSVFLLVGNL